MSDVLVTGGSGFVGRNLIPYLEKRALSVKTLSLRESWEQQFPDNIISVIHLAGKAHDTRNISDLEEYLKINTELTKQLFNLFCNSKAEDFFYFSSVKAAADSVDGVLVEELKPNPHTPYGISKQKAEDYLLSKVLPPGKRLFVIRPCMVHGPGNKGNLNLLYKFVSKGIPYPLAAFENKRSFLSVENLCYATNAMLVNKTVPSGIYNLADDDALSTNELVIIIAAAMGKKNKLLKISPGILRRAARIGDLLKLPLNSERLKKLTGNYVVSNDKIKKALGISAFPVSAKDGLIKTIKSFASE